MANTSYQLKNVEDWIRNKWLPGKFGQLFSKKGLKLKSGGTFEFDAVSEDNSMAAAVSTSGLRTSGGKNGSGKIKKIQADMLFLTQIKGKKRIMILLTEKDMFNAFEQEIKKGRVPNKMEIYHVKLPSGINNKLKVARQASSKEIISVK